MRCAVDLVRVRAQAVSADAGKAGAVRVLRSYLLNADTQLHQRDCCLRMIQ